MTSAGLIDRKGVISRLGFEIELGLRYDSGHWLGLEMGLGLGIGSEIRAQGL